MVVIFGNKTVLGAPSTTMLKYNVEWTYLPKILRKFKNKNWKVYRMRMNPIIFSYYLQYQNLSPLAKLMT